MFLNTMSNFKHNKFYNCHFNTRAPIPTKIGQAIVKESIYTNIDSHAYDSPIFTKTR